MVIGCSKVDFTPDEHRLGMLGYGVHHHTVHDVHTRLYTRSFYLAEHDRNDAPCTVINVSELGFITPILKKKVLELLHETHGLKQITEGNLMLLAQHTHSAPAGFSYYPFYNISTPGLVPETLMCYAKGIAESINNAYNDRKNGSIRLNSGEVAENIELGFNRALRAYNRNRDVETLTDDEKHLAVDRTMTMLSFVDEAGVPIGSLNWLACHTTSLPNTMNKVHSDNKGYAALYLEDQHNTDSYVGAFAHGHSGDVTPNYIYDRSRKHNRFWNGPYKDQDRNALTNGRLQYEQASEIESKTTEEHTIDGKIEAIHTWKAMGHLKIDPEYADGRKDAITSPSCLGVAMFVGTHTDGLGFPDVITPLAKSLSNAVRTYEENVLSLFRGPRARELKEKYRAQGVKEILMETGVNRLFGTADIKNFIMPGVVDKTVEYIKHFAATGAYDRLPMTPQVLPFQIVRIGSLAIVSLPFELTTVSGKRLTTALEQELIGDGIKHVQVCGYANAYNGYITTFEEYQEQQYEAGHTVFGQWSLAAATQLTTELAREFKKDASERNMEEDELPFPTAEELKALIY